MLLWRCGDGGGLYVWGMGRSATLADLAAVSFTCGGLVLPLALMSGIDQYADELLSVHVIEHLLLILRRADADLVGCAGEAGVERFHCRLRDMRSAVVAARAPDALVDKAGVRVRAVRGCGARHALDGRL